MIILPLYPMINTFSGEKTKYPIFFNPNPYICVLSAITIGCDVFVGDVKRLGVVLVWASIEMLKREDNNNGKVCTKLASFIIEKGDMKKEVLDVYVKAFLCKPANEVIQDNSNISYHYLHTSPTILPR